MIAAPEIRTCSEMRLAGLSQTTQLTRASTPLLWQKFMPRRTELSSTLEEAYYGAQVMEPGFHIRHMTLQTPFQEWATMNVASDTPIPTGMEVLEIPVSLYAVFIHKGLPSEFKRTFQYIYFEWLPTSGYDYDNRPQLQVMPPDYRPDDPEAEEEIWVPIKPK